MISESVKAVIANSRFNIFITVGFLALAVAIILIIGYVENKRIDNGKSTNSIAIRSSKFISDYYRHVKHFAKTNQWDEKEAQVLKDVEAISRHLLLIGEYKVRFYLGKLIYENSKNELHRLNALIDEMGWTSVMMGRKSAVKYFLQAIGDVDGMIKQVQGHLTLYYNETDDYSLTKLFMKARAYRHLGSTPSLKSYEKIEYCKKGLAIVEYLESLPALPKEISKDKILNMRTGLYFGIGAANLLQFSNCKVKNLADPIGNLVQAYKFNLLAKENAVTFENKHRYIKCLLTENEIYRGRMMINDYKDSVKKKALEDKVQGIMELDELTFEENLKTVERLMNDSIYIDEAYETYLIEKIKHWGESDA